MGNNEAATVTTNAFLPLKWGKNECSDGIPYCLLLTLVSPMKVNSVCLLSKFSEFTHQIQWIYWDRRYRNKKHLTGVFYEGGTSCLRRCRFLGSKVRASRVEGAAFMGWRLRVQDFTRLFVTLTSSKVLTHSLHAKRLCRLPELRSPTRSLSRKSK